MPPGKIPQFLPAAALFTGAVASTPDEQQIFVISKGHARLCLVQIHAVHIRCAFECDDIRAVLVKLEEITAVLVEKGEVGSHNNLLGTNPSMIRHVRSTKQLLHPRVLIDVKVFCNGGDEFQRMKLRLIGKSDRAGNGKRKRNLVRKFSRKAQFFKGFQLLLSLTPVVSRIGVGRLFLKIAVNIPAQLSVCLKSCFVGGKILLCSLDSKPGNQLVIDKPVLAGDFGGGVFGDAAAHCFRFRQHIRHSGTVQLIGTQNACHTAAYNQHIGVYISVLSRKVRLLSVSLP